MATKLTLYLQNDQRVTLERVTDQAGALVTGATITAKLVDRAGTQKAVLTFADVDGVAGNYFAAMQADEVPGVGSYTLQVTGVVSGADLYFETACIVVKRVL
jgi:hypothetical protein